MTLGANHPVFSIQLFARTDDHESHAGEEENDEPYHEKHAQRKTRADARNAAVTCHTRGFLASRACEQRWHETERQRTEQRQKPHHGIL